MFSKVHFHVFSFDSPAIPRTNPAQRIAVKHPVKVWNTSRVFHWYWREDIHTISYPVQCYRASLSVVHVLISDIYMYILSFLHYRWQLWGRPCSRPLGVCCPGSSGTPFLNSFWPAILFISSCDVFFLTYIEGTFPCHSAILSLFFYSLSIFFGFSATLIVL